MRSGPLRLVLLVALCAVVGGCGAAGGPSPVPAGPPPSQLPPRTGPPPGTGPPTPAGPAPMAPAPSPLAGCVTRVMAGMSLEARVGQLLFVGLPAGGPSAAQVATVRRYAAGGVLLTGRSTAGTAAVAAMTAGLRRQAGSAGGVDVVVAVDQEGGQVQALSGPGFSEIPSAAVQGQWSPDRLQAAARGWGVELRSAGVDVDLAPVADVLSAQLGEANAPIGRPHRAFGTEPAAVAAHVTAFVRGMQAAGMDTAVKHFPGLGRVRGNTDFSSGVTDDRTSADDPALAPFRAGVTSGTPFLMVSSATYPRIDPQHRAVFSPIVLQGLVRGSLGYPGVIVSDDLGAAEEVAAVPPGERAVRFLAAGGDVVLTVDPDTVGAMAGAVVATARSDPGFASSVDASVRRVLAAKAARGRVRC